ncbi:MAG: DNA adenine methylase [Nitrospirae bacterium]|nr:DNA adenine methylase [Nitrospirota bacterium]
MLFDLIPSPHPDRVINVAQVKQLSPFRYPGGKTWLVPWVKKWLLHLQQFDAVFIEPFAGGGITSLTVAHNRLASRCLMVEKDEDIAAVWQTIVYGNWQYLIDRILNFNLSYENAKQIIDAKPQTTEEKAFQTILKNRIYHGGILAAGSGMLKNGENSKGIHSRWYPETITKRIKAISLIKSYLEFINGDGFEIITEHLNNPNAIFFIDPPYTASKKKAGTRLYRYHKIDHEKLFSLMSGVRGNFMMTYDDSPEILDYCQQHNLQFVRVPMTGTHHRKLFELLICNDIIWSSIL